MTQSPGDFIRLTVLAVAGLVFVWAGVRSLRGDDPFAVEWKTSERAVQGDLRRKDRLAGAFGILYVLLGVMTIHIVVKLSGR